MPVKSDLLTPREAMEYLRVSRSKFWRMRTSGQISAVKFGEKLYRYHKADLDALITKSSRLSTESKEAAR